MKELEEKSLFLKCQCCTHCFEIQRFSDDVCDNIKDEGFFLTFWEYGRSNSILCWKERFRWIWNIFRTGKPWSDGVIIGDKQAVEIVNYINKHLSKE